jgi:uncharacterized protein YecE (DUF72 family)
MAALQDAGKLGAVLHQFPYRFHHTPEHRAHLDRLADAFRAYPFMLDIRHRAWDQPQVYDFPCELGMGFCNIDQPQVSYSMGLTQVVTSPIGDLQWHGRNAAMWFAEADSLDRRYDYRSSDEELDDLVETVAILGRRSRDTYVTTSTCQRASCIWRRMPTFATRRSSRANHRRGVGGTGAVGHCADGGEARGATAKTTMGPSLG